MKLIIEHDQDPMNPREEYDQLVSLAMFHRRYNLPNDSKLDHTGCWKEMEGKIKRQCGAVYIVPIYMYDHSGTAYSREKFDCKWDSGQIGFAYLTKKAISNFGWKRVTKGREQQLNDAIDATLHEWECYENGEVYGYAVEDPDGDLVDCCTGFFGGDHNKNGLKENLQEYLKHLVEKIGYGAGEASLFSEEEA